MTIARNALYFEDYVLSIQYFNQVINAQPYLYEPYFFRGLAKINLDDYQGAESACDAAIQDVYKRQVSDSFTTFSIAL